MHSSLPALIERLDYISRFKNNVLHWGSPVPAFGDAATAKVATLGLNPSNREFVDEVGNELEGKQRRFHTLRSLGIKRWQDAKPEHLDKIIFTCKKYFAGNPFDKWFRRLDSVIAGSGASYYPDQLLGGYAACHLDLIPYATVCKWAELTKAERAELLTLSGDTLGHLLSGSPIQLIILNGQTVVDQFEGVSGIELQKTEMRNWTLPRNKTSGVSGFAYQGTITHIHNIDLHREVHVLGYNHNIQSSFGVTRQVMASISEWISNYDREGEW
jgi:hypothetical protein